MSHLRGHNQNASSALPPGNVNNQGYLELERQARVENERRRIVREGDFGSKIPGGSKRRRTVPLGSLPGTGSDSNLFPVLAPGPSTNVSNNGEITRTSTANGGDYGQISTLVSRSEKLERTIADQSRQRQRDMELISGLQDRLQRMETELVRVRLDAEKPGDNQIAKVNHNLLEHLRRSEKERSETIKTIINLQDTVRGLERKLVVSEKVTEDKVTGTEYQVDRLQLASQLEGKRMSMINAIVEREMKVALNRTSSLEAKIKSLETNISLVQQTAKEKEFDSTETKKLTMERLERLNELVSKKEKALAEKIVQVQNSISVIDSYERENGERRIRLFQQENEMVKQATDIRVGMAETSVGRERRERLAAEAKLRKDLAIKWESFESSLREHESLLTSGNSRFVKETKVAIEGQNHQIKLSKDRLDKGLQKILAQVESFRTAFKTLKDQTSDATSSATKKLEGLLRAEIKVRTSAILKLQTAQEESREFVQEEMSKISAKDAAQLELLSSKINALERTMQDMDVQSRKEMKSMQATLKSEQLNASQELANKIELIGTRIDKTQENIDVVRKVLEEGTVKKVKEVMVKVLDMECETSASLEKLGKTFSGHIDNLQKDLEKKISTESMEQNGALEAFKRESQEKFVDLTIQMEHEISNLKADITANWGESRKALHALDQHIHKELVETTHQLKQGISLMREEQKNALSQTKESITMTLSSHQEEQQDIAKRLVSLSDRVQNEDDSIRQTLRSRCSSIEHQTEGLAKMLAEVEANLSAERSRAITDENTLREDISKFSTEAFTRSQNISSELNTTMQRFSDESNNKLTSYVDHKASVLRSLVKTSIQGEQASRVKTARNLKEDLEKAIVNQQKQQQNYIDERISILSEKTDFRIKEEAERRKHSHVVLQTELKRDISETHETLQNDLEIRSIVDYLLTFVEQEQYDAAHIALSEKHDTTTKHLHDKLAATGKELAVIHSSLGKEIAKERTDRNDQVSEVQDVTEGKLQDERTNREKQLEEQRNNMLEEIVKESQKLQIHSEQQLEKTKAALFKDLEETKARHLELSKRQSENYDKLGSRATDIEVASCLDRIMEALTQEQMESAYSATTDNLKNHLSKLAANENIILEQVGKLGTRMSALSEECTEKMLSTEVKLQEDLIGLEQQDALLRTEQTTIKEAVEALQKESDTFRVMVSKQPQLEERVEKESTTLQEIVLKQPQLEERIEELSTLVSSSNDGIETLKSETVELREMITTQTRDKPKAQETKPVEKRAATPESKVLKGPEPEVNEPEEKKPEENEPEEKAPEQTPKKEATTNETVVATTTVSETKTTTVTESEPVVEARKAITGDLVPKEEQEFPDEV